MQGFKRKFKEWVYSFSTEDHYAEYDPNEEPSFNMRQRTGPPGGVNPSSMNLTGGAAAEGDEEMHVGMSGIADSINIDALEGNEGVSDVLLAWRHIDAWSEKHNPDLNATLGDPVTNNDILHAEEDLEISLPPSVKVSMRIHDGQEDLESMTGTSGLFYGLPLMTLDQVVAMTQAWRNVASNLNRQSQQNSGSAEGKSTDRQPQQQQQQQRSQFKLPFIPPQGSVPPDAVINVYAHPAWIPLLTDNAGNHIGVDLAPGPKGHYGQVITFGRDFDVKYVVGANWGEFLLSFANDLEAGNWFLIEESDDYFAGDGELVFRDKKSNGQIQDYLEVLKKRVLLKNKDLLKTGNQQSTQKQAAQQQQVPPPVPPKNEQMANELTFDDSVATVKQTQPNEFKRGDAVPTTENEDDLDAIVTDDEGQEEHDIMDEPIEEPAETAAHTPAQEPETLQASIAEPQEEKRQEAPEQAAETAIDQDAEAVKQATEDDTEKTVNNSEEATETTPIEPEEEEAVESKEDETTEPELNENAKPEIEEEPKAEETEEITTPKEDVVAEEPEVKELKEEFEAVAL
ncbi:Smi1p KNAG_0A01590 [Huiozyma naganishii CBS 8797]|uniref:Knr4/Smi1-like domain-containing protein n=1 Tax=Huiozyma naganishii (strain ATCC MYA-139 / BCRC 22969 / CBS 8797 / KCTC 17520 / NBRC 10181 / NCYC 3082 / Yp74L-3) TaxID=1071383 RepID=J7RE64_HUIN7|nr:hypothetical protein KNAG_0A01590 [Kazachstania naganishii CBS 8797]CCK67848.1 hypothetical protein KNAG_0A01590 [Kazachstania naganishii CBS 8797]